MAGGFAEGRLRAIAGLPRIASLSEKKRADQGISA
jgi:hypothetical protein